MLYRYENELRPYLRSITSDNPHTSPSLDKREASTIKVLTSLATGNQEAATAVEQKVINSDQNVIIMRRNVTGG